jgi:hypothetical protein
LVIPGLLELLDALPGATVFHPGPGNSGLERDRIDHADHVSNRAPAARDRPHP